MKKHQINIFEQTTQITHCMIYCQPPRPIVAEISATKLKIAIHLTFVTTSVIIFKTNEIPVKSTKAPLSPHAKSSCVY